MANVNRWIDGRRNVKLVTVLSAVTVEVGDMMFLDNADNLRNDGSSTANYYAYPLKHFRLSGSSLELNKAGIKSRFIGVALDDKDGISGGSNINIPIASSGKFKFDLKPAKTVYVGNMFGASGTTSASNLFNQKVAKVTDSSLFLGYFAESKVHAQDARVILKTAFGPG